MTIKLTEKILKMCAGVLSHYGSMCGNKICQDFDSYAVGLAKPTEFFGKDLCDDIARQYEQENSGGQDYDDESWQSLDDAMVLGFALSNVLSNAAIDSGSRIKLTKELPTEAGEYLWCEKSGDPVKHCYLDFELEDGLSDMISGFKVEEIGGYWWRIDQSMFEVAE